MKLRFPGVWEETAPQWMAQLETGGWAQVGKHLARWREREDHAVKKLSLQPSSKNLTRELVACRMVLTAMQTVLAAALAGSGSGKVRLSLWDGWLLQRLLLRRGLERRPASLRWFRWLWPLVRQKHLLMLLVQPRGIYCFYSRELLKALAALIGKRSTLEIAAGDGTLTRFLREEGVNIQATDDYSWAHSIQYPPDVVKSDAVSALQVHQPEVVICSWPPPGNTFERRVFVTRSVRLYIVIGSCHAFASGNREDYGAQTVFSQRSDPALARLIIPPELNSEVFLFERKPQT